MYYCAWYELRHASAWPSALRGCTVVLTHLKCYIMLTKCVPFVIQNYLVRSVTEMCAMHMTVIVWRQDIRQRVQTFFALWYVGASDLGVSKLLGGPLVLLY